MIYTIETQILSEKSRFLVKEKHNKYFTYKSLKKIQKLLEEKKEIYSMGYDLGLTQILSIDFVGLQDFFKVETFSGAKLYIGVDCELYVDGEWVRVEELVFHEKLYVYDMLDDVFRDTYITKILNNTRNFKAYKVSIDRREGVIVNNLIIRFEGDPVEEAEEDASNSLVSGDSV